MRRDVYQAIADPTRREILGMIAQQSMNVNSVAENFEVSRTAVYKHIKILTECGLLVLKQNGREKYCEAKLESLSEVSDWIMQYKKYWTSKFDGLENYLTKAQIKRKSKRKLSKNK